MIPAPTADFISSQVRRARLFFLDLAPPPGGDPLTVVCGGFEAVASDYRIDRGGFPWLSLEFVLSGQGRLHLAGRAATLRAGSFFVYGPGLPHRIESIPAHPLEKYFIDFTGKEAGALVERLGLAPGAFGECTRPALLREDFEALIEAGTRRSPHAAEYCRARTLQLLVNCADFRAQAGTLGSRAFQTYERCRQRITEQAATLRSLDAMAALCHVDKAYLCRLFARFHDETPHAFLQRLRIDLAAERLLASDDTVKAVSEACGFADPFHFSRVFRRLKGVPPARYALTKRPS